MEATPAFHGRGVPGSSPAFVPPASVHKAAMAQRPGQRGPSAAWVYRQLQKCLCLTPAGLRSTEVTQGQCSAELTVNSEEIPWLELCLPSFFICPDCFFSLGFRSSRTQGFICLQTFLFLQVTSCFNCRGVPDTETQAIHGEHRRVSVSK